jgi:hypothetical protein
VPGGEAGLPELDGARQGGEVGAFCFIFAASCLRLCGPGRLGRLIGMIGGEVGLVWSVALFETWGGRGASGGVRVRVEIMGSQTCGIVGKSQPVLMMINAIIFTRTRTPPQVGPDADASDGGLSEVIIESQWVPR